MTSAAVQELADQLHRAAQSGQAIEPIRDRLEAGGIDAAYAVQQINTQRALAAGRRAVGFKIGLTSLAVQRQLGVDQPDFGVLFADMAFGDGDEIPWARTMQAKAEAEVALVMAHDLTEPELTLADLIGAAAYVLPAVEVVGSRIANWKIGILDTVADNASSGLFVLGATPKKLADVDLRLAGMVMTRRGEPVSLGAGAACLGHPLNAALWLARKMAALETPLRAGDVVLTGALGPMVPVTPGDRLEARINGLGSLRVVFGKAAA